MDVIRCDDLQMTAREEDHTDTTSCSTATYVRCFNRLQSEELLVQQGMGWDGECNGHNGDVPHSEWSRSSKMLNIVLLCCIILLLKININLA